MELAADARNVNERVFADRVATFAARTYCDAAAESRAAEAWSEALSLLNTAIDYRPHRQAYLDRAQVFRAMGDEASAEADQGRAEKLPERSADD